MSDYKVSLAAARVNAGLNQREAAEKLGICLATLVNWETGRTFPTARKIQLLCHLYEVPMNFLKILPRG